MKKMAGTTQPKAHSSNTTELLLEIGVEELPYQFISPALSSLEDLAARLFQEARLSSGSIKAYGTPRRLTLVVQSLAVHQTAVTRETMGPSKSVAFDQAGQPTKAAIGFATGQGVSVESLQARQTPKGEYLFAIKEDVGRSTNAVLLELLPQLIGKLSFPKAMKWNESGMRFARPIRWLLALCGGTVLPIKASGVKAGKRTYGHRVLSGGKPIVVRDFGSYSKGLEKAGVLVDPVRRRNVITAQLQELCAKKGVGLN